MTLAITGLVIVGVLQFLPSVQESGRDSARKTAVTKVELALEQWAATHSGSYGKDVGGSVVMVEVSDLYAGNYIGGDVKDPSTGAAYSDPGGLPGSGALAIRDRSGGTSGSLGYCIVIQLESDQDRYFRASDRDKSGKLVAGSSLGVVCQAS